MFDKDQNNSFNLLSIFSTLTPIQQQQIKTQTSTLSIKAGETLIKKGENADSLFFLQQGRLIVISDEKPIAEILPGESIGEMAFLTGGKRTATVMASRNSKLLQLDQTTYKSLINNIPELTQAVIQSLAQRLNASNINTPEIEPSAGNVVALLPAGNSTIPKEFINQFLSTKNELSSSWKIIQATEINNPDELIEWIEENEPHAYQLILIATDSHKNPDITLAMAENADKSFLVLDNRQSLNISVTDFENTVYKNSFLNNVDLVILREQFTDKITGTSKLLQNRNIHLHHHVAINHQPDLERLQRFIAGKALGLVLCGGGALGAAHIGMMKALQEHDYNFDFIGGTSIGSVIASIYAMGFTPDEALHQIEEVFITKKALGKYSLPLYSFVDHKHVDDALKIGANNNDIEDLPINYFATATNLSNNQLKVIRNGPLWQAVRSSCSLPGILPPYITDDGDVLIDGGLMDNTPINSLRLLKPGPNIVMNFTPQQAWKVNSQYDALPRGKALLKKILLPKTKNQKYYPSIFTILSRSMVTNTIKRFADINQREDVFLEPTKLKGMGMMTWKKSREQFELSYKHMKTALSNADFDKPQDKMTTLREIANTIKIGNSKENKD